MMPWRWNNTYPNSKKAQKTERYCGVCKKMTIWMYDPVITHSRCEECGCHGPIKELEEQKMSFDKSLDKCIKSETLDFDGTKITVSVMSYNEGARKMQLSRIRMKDGEEQFAKLGRLTKDEVEKILPVMQELLKEL